MKVTWLCLEWPREDEHVGGVGRYVMRLAAEMRQLVQLTVVAPRGGILLNDVEVVRMRPTRSRLDRYYGLPIAARRAVSATAPELVHAHGDDWALVSGAPVVRSFYGSSWSEARSSRGIRRVNHAILAATEQISARRATVRLGIALESVQVFHCDFLVPPIVGLRESVPRSPTEGPTIVFIGSFHGRKRGWMAQEAAAEARRRLGTSVSLVVVGPKEDAGFWAPWVEHVSGVTDDEVAGLLASAWVLLAPSSYEGFGIPVIEALQAGLPVVASPTPGSRYLLERAEPLVPLSLEADAAIADAVVQCIQSGPTLSASQLRATEGFIGQLRRDGSAERLKEIYDATVRSARRLA